MSNIYFTHFIGYWASFVCSCHSILERCVMFSGVKLRIIHMHFAPQTARQARLRFAVDRTTGKRRVLLCRTPGKCHNLLSRTQIQVEAAIMWRERQDGQPVCYKKFPRSFQLLKYAFNEISEWFRANDYIPTVFSAKQSQVQTKLARFISNFAAYITASCFKLQDIDSSSYNIGIHVHVQIYL